MTTPTRKRLIGFHRREEGGDSKKSSNALSLMERLMALDGKNHGRNGDRSLDPHAWLLAVGGNERENTVRVEPHPAVVIRGLAFALAGNAALRNMLCLAVNFAEVLADAEANGESALAGTEQLTRSMEDGDAR